ncbi:MAG: hypothetical protein K0U52_12055, partial [Gammaproteobacteria bacterium]|nr:hypothetical protein [Gammaproteobacteria bacterium]
VPTLGSIIMEVEEGGRQFKGRPAVPEEKRQHIWDNQSLYLGQICTVLFDSWTNKNAVPRFPRVVGFRSPDDMGVGDVGVDDGVGSEGNQCD